MKSQHETEYLELLEGVRSYLSEEYPKGTFLCADKENWEVLHRQLLPTRRVLSPPQKAPSAVKPQMPPHPSPLPQSKAPLSPLPSTARPATPRVEPPPPKKPVEEKISRSLYLSERPTPGSLDFTEWKKIFLDKFPHIPLVESPLADQTEKVVITIVHGAASPEELHFLENVARSCHLLLGKTKVIAVEQFKSEQGGKFFTYGIQIENGIPIQPLSFYLRNPQAKALLWRQLTAEAYE